MLQGIYRVDDLSTVLLLEKKIRKHLHWFDKEPAGVQRITTVHKQKSRHSCRILPAKFINVWLLHAAMIKPFSAPELSHLGGSTHFCALHIANICSNDSLLWRASSHSNSQEFLWCSIGLLFIYLTCLLPNLQHPWWIFHKLNPFLQVTSIAEITLIISLQGGSRSPHPLLLQLSISAIDNLRGLTAFAITQKQSWAPVDGKRWWKSLIWGFLTSANIAHSKVYFFFFFPWDTIINEENCKSLVSAFKEISRFKSTN